MGTTIEESAMNIWSVSDKSQKLKLMRKFLEKNGELTSQNDFVGFLARECSRDIPGDGETLDSQ